MDPPAAQGVFDEALRDHQAGRLKEAERAYRRILAENPDHAGATLYLGVIAHRSGQLAGAVALLRRAIALEPNSVEAHCNLGNALQEQKQFDDAIASYHRALDLKPDHSQSHNNLGNALAAIRRTDEAIAAYKHAIFSRPDYSRAYNNLGVALASQGKTTEAIAAYRQCLQLQLDDAEALSNLGIALQRDGQLDEAIAAHEQAISLQPLNAAAHTNLGAAFYASVSIDKAIAAHRHAIALRPDFAQAHHNLALALLLAGQFDEGWKEYEWRWKWDGFPSPLREFTRPVWDGSPLCGKTILIHAEQGIGDTIQFVRYLPALQLRFGPKLARDTGSILFECAPELVRLLRCVPELDDIRIIPRNGLGESLLPRFDVHAPLMSLPHLLRLPKPTEIPASPYLFVKRDQQSSSIPPVSDASLLRVGLAWAGSPQHSEDPRRSIPREVLQPLLHCNADFYSLQVAGDGQPQTGHARFIDLTDRIYNFVDTALLISQLHLVISVDTAVAHLAGAMGKPTWLLLAYAPDWRWGLHRDDTDWYAGMKIFRQSRPGDWDEVIARLAGRFPPCTTVF